MSCTYPYVGGDPLENRLSYTYTEFVGKRLLDDWQRARQSACQVPFSCASVASTHIQQLPDRQQQQVDTVALLTALAASCDMAVLSPEAEYWLNWIIQRFEVSKRQFSRYNLTGVRPRGEGDYRQLSLYLHLAEVLALAFERHQKLPALNALLKCLDTLTSYVVKLDREQQSRLTGLIERELQMVEAVIRDSVSAAHHDKALIAAARPANAEIVLPNVVLLAADTLRSRGYAQALHNSGIKVQATVLISNPDGPRKWGQAEAPAQQSDTPGSLFIPDLRVPLTESCAALGGGVERLTAGTVNHPDVARQVLCYKPSLVIYSGFGGEIVDLSLFDNIPFLHMHAGWLPDYRGSTTSYYSMLRDGECGVSAIVLSEGIDEGRILARHRYAPPPVDMDLDYVYDAAIRADTLVTVLQQLAKTGMLPDGVTQKSDKGEVYYIIHPVLKHISILANAGKLTV